MEPKRILLVEHGTSIKEYAVDAARELGYEVFMVSNSYSDNLRLLIGPDNFYISDVFDSQKLLTDTLRFIESRGIRFELITTFRENCIISTADLADALGLRGVSPRGGRRSSQNKALMRHALAASDYPYQPAYKIINLYDECAAKIYDAFPKPCVAKPLFGTASHGVVYSQELSFQDLFDHMKRAITPEAREVFEKFEGTILIEEYRPGTLISVDGIVIDGKFYKAGTIEFVMGKLPYFTQVASFMPARISESEEHLLERATQLAVSELGFQNCGVHAEFRFLGEEITLIEIAARLPGATIHDSYKRVYGSDLILALLEALGAGTKPDFKRNKVVAYHHLLFSPTAAPGTLESVVIPEAIEEKVTDFLQLASNGSKLAWYPDNPTPVAGYLLLGSDYVELVSEADRIDQLIQINLL